MDKLPHSVLLDILSRLDNSADVARCRVASKDFNTVFPGLRSINLLYSFDWYYKCNSRFRISQPLKTVFMDLISKLETVESVCLVVERDFNLVDGDFAKEWLPRVSGPLKSLALSGDQYWLGQRQSNIWTLISAYCHHLVNLSLTNVSLSVHNMNPMPMLTTLTLEFIFLKDKRLNVLNRCLPNLQFLKLGNVHGLKDPKIHLLNLKTCLWFADDHYLRSLTLITPNLITLTLEGITPTAVHVEAPMLSHFHLRLNASEHVSAFTIKKFENLKTLWLESSYIGSMLSEFPITETLKTLTLDSGDTVVRDFFTLGKVFTLFPNITSLCVKPGAWWKLETCLKEGWEILDGGKGLETICAYSELVDPRLSFSYVAYVLDHCVSLSEVSLLIHGDVECTVAESFMSKCMARWPGLKWRWGIWCKNMDDTWIAPRFIEEVPLVC